MQLGHLRQLALHFLLQLSPAQATLAASSGVHASCMDIFLNRMLNDPLLVELRRQDQRNIVKELFLALGIRLLRDRIKGKRLSDTFVVLVGVLIWTIRLHDFTALVALEVIEVVKLVFFLK